MTRSLVVSADLELLRQDVVALRVDGYDVATCPGPDAGDCPVLRGRACGLAERADVLVYDRRLLEAPGPGASLLAELRSLYADKPIVLTDADSARAPADRHIDDGVWRVVGTPDPARLALTLEEALGER